MPALCGTSARERPQTIPERWLRPLLGRPVDTHLSELSYRLLLPAISDLDVGMVRMLFGRGCRSVLFGETRPEYLARSMSRARGTPESSDSVRAAVRLLQDSAGGAILVAVDHELDGICRFENLLPAAPKTRTVPDVRAYAKATGGTLAALGVNVTLGPIMDVVRGTNPWLDGRNVGADPPLVAALGRAMITGLRTAGVLAVAKHFPGHAKVETDPATSAAFVRTPVDELERLDEPPFVAAVAAGACGLMLGPAVVTGIDPDHPASLSAIVARRARKVVGVDGVLVTDDLDAVSILGDRTVGQAAVAAVAAGADLLLVAAGAADECALAITEAVERGDLPRDLLSEAVGRVQRLTETSRQLAPPE